MKKIIIAFALLSVFAINAQGEYREKAKQVKSLKVAFITNELALTPDEAAKFWPVYNEFEVRQSELRRKKVANYIDRKNTSIDQLSDKDALAVIHQMEKDEDELHSLRKKLTSNLKSVISPQKILKLKKAEEDFSRRLLKQYRQKKK